MQQRRHTPARGHLAQEHHRQLVLVARGHRVVKEHGHLVLRGRDLIVLRLGSHAHLPQLLVELGHELRHPLADGGIILVLHLLPLGRTGAEERAPGVDQVAAATVELAVDEEVFLLQTDLCLDAARMRVAQAAQHAHRLTGENLLRAQQRRARVQRLARIRAEGRGDAQRNDAVGILADEGRRRAVPRGIAARLKRRAQAARREGRGVRLAADERLARELQQHAAVVRGQKRVLLFGRLAVHRLEPVRVVRGAALHRPLLHGRCNDLCDRGIQLRPFVDGPMQRTVDVLRQAHAHDLVGKYVLSKYVCEHFLALFHRWQLLRPFSSKSAFKNHFSPKILRFGDPLYHFTLL